MKRSLIAVLLTLSLLATGCLGGGTERISVSWRTENRAETTALGTVMPAQLGQDNLAYMDSPLEYSWLVAEAEIRGGRSYSEDGFEFQVVSEGEAPNSFEIEGDSLFMDKRFADEGHVHVRHGDLETVSPYKIYPSAAIGKHTPHREIYTHLNFEAGETNSEVGDLYYCESVPEAGEAWGRGEVWATLGYAAIPKGESFGLFWGDFPTNIDFESYDYTQGSFKPEFGTIYLVKTTNGYAKMFMSSWQSVPAWNFIYEYVPN